MTEREPADASAAEVLSRVLASVERGELDSPRRVTDALRGAQTALEATESDAAVTAGEQLR